MSSFTLSNDDLAQSEGPAWSAVFAMALCVFVPIASEFMPVSLLSPIVHDLALTAWQAGQAISIFGIFAVFSRRFSFAGAGHHLWRQRALVCDRSSSGQLSGWARRLERCVLLRRSISGHRPDLAAFDASPAARRETVRS